MMPAASNTLRWDPDALGSHRAVIEVDRDADAVCLTVPWRRRDREVAGKGIILLADGSSEPIRNVIRISATRGAGRFVFQPAQGLGTYFLYYLPFTGDAQAHYPALEYRPYEQTAESAWAARHGLDAPDGLGGPSRADLPEARFVRIESVDEHNAFTRMERPATPQEVDRLLERHPEETFLIFPADRTCPIRMRHDIPAHWAASGPSEFHGTARPGEFYVFQVGVFAARADLHGLTVTFSDLRCAEATIHASRFRCLNLGGIAWDGRPFCKVVHVGQGDVQALWCGVEIPQDVAVGAYSGEVVVGADGQQTQTARFVISVAGPRIENAGDDEPWRLSRLRWLDSTKGSEDEVVPPFTPVAIEGRRLRILGREVALSRQGLPSRLTSYFTPGVTGVREAGRELLAGAMRFLVTLADGTVVECSADGPLGIQGGEARARWHTGGAAAALEVTVRGEMEFDGTMEFSIRVRAREETIVRDLALHVPFGNDAVPYMTGLGRKGGARPEVFSWHWDTSRNQDAFWLGDANVGAQVTLKDESYSRPLNTNFYHLKPLVLPDSWHNAGAGGVRMGPPDSSAFPVVCFSGPRTLGADEDLVFQFRLMLTPFKPLDTRAHFRTRFYHAPVTPAEAVAQGANTINIHHAKELNPYINYPFFRTEALRAYVEDAHALGCRVKLYYTVRELTTRAPELFPLISLGDEVIVDGPGGGHAWLMEHLEEHYVAAWHAASVRDTSVINGVLSRWHNHYVEGLDWLARCVGVDGVYIDDLGFGREIMKRVRRVLARHRPDPNIDLHSANQFNEKDGFASSANLYMEHFPYVDRLWFGEYFDYDEPPEYWLVEVSGIPFGLMSEMLQDGGNPWRGMLFGMTGRMPHVALTKALWAFWDAHGLSDSEMIGWWSDDCPAKTGDHNVRCTVYASDRRAIIAVASWHKEAVRVKLELDWNRLGMDAGRTTLHAPEVPGFQEARAFALSDPIPVEAGKGWLLVLEG